MYINVREHRKCQAKMNNLEKLATLGTQGEDNKNTTQYVVDTTMRR
jgi:hypothetical protein